MPSNTLVSVIIPAYNAAQTIKRAIHSVLSQSYRYIEVIIVDDGSNDDTVECVKSFGEQVHCVVQQNGGAGAARNRGAQAATGEWIAFLDADDEWHSRKLEIQLQYLDVATNLVLVSNTPVIVRPGQQESFGDIEGKPGFFIWEHRAFLRRNRIHTSSVLIKREAYQAVGGCDITLLNAQDRDLWLKLLYYGKGICIDFPLTKYYHIGGSLSHNLVRRFNCDLTLIDRWDNRQPGNLDINKTVPVKEFCKIKYAAMFTMIFKLMRIGFVTDAKDFWQRLCIFHKKTYPFVPCIPWLLFVALARMEKIRKHVKYGTVRDDLRTDSPE
ncbi:MAG: glycosyltransferase family protein [Sporomusa sp.]|nr:glycosyltransferase family protein [Sporomusa sp.]